MFSLSKGHDFITLQQLRRKINTIDLYDSPSTSKTKEGNQNLENNFLEKAEEDGGGDSVKNQKSESDSDEFEFKKDNLGKL